MCFVFHFVWGAPCMCEENVSPAKKVGNGTPGFFHSLCFENDEMPPEGRAVTLSKPTLGGAASEPSDARAVP